MQYSVAGEKIILPWDMAQMEPSGRDLDGKSVYYFWRTPAKFGGEETASDFFGDASLRVWQKRRITAGAGRMFHCTSRGWGRTCFLDLEISASDCGAGIIQRSTAIPGVRRGYLLVL